MAKSRPLSVFCSYSHKDERLRAEVAAGLAGLVREGLIREVWYDRKIAAGAEWAQIIDKALFESDIVLFLVSSNFISSDYCMGIEVVRAIARHKEGETRAIPIILEPCDWETAPFAELQALPVAGKPLRAWMAVNKNRLKEVSQGIRNVVAELCTNGNDSLHRRLPSTLDASQTILAHLCNRVEQDRQLIDAWRLHDSSLELRGRPFVCVVHGAVQEDHVGYLQRLTAYSFRQEIGLGREPEIHRPLRVKWPEDCADKPSGPSSMLGNLAKELQCSAQVDEVSTTLRRLGESCIVYYELLSGFKNYGDRVAVESFFDFWANWPDLRFRQKLLVVLSVQYRPGFPARFPKVDADIVTNAHRSRRLSAIVLDELPSVSSQHVKDWIRHPAV